MTTITFYSYKGGTGRTLLLANIARELTWAGQKVFALDLDLEAPGLHYKFALGDDRPLNVSPGALDYIHTFVATGKRPEVLAHHVTPVPLPPEARGRLHLMAAGNVLTGDYWKKLARINWHDLFYDSAAPPGVPLFLDLKARIEQDYKPDYLLIDSRTGVTEIGGVAVTLLPDCVVCPLLVNRENRDGARQVLRSILRAARERQCPVPRIVPVLSRVAVDDNPSSETEIVDEIRRFLNEDAPDLADTLNVQGIPVLHWDRAIEMKEALLLGEGRPAVGRPLHTDYLNLVQRLIPQAPGKRKVFLSSTGSDLRAHREAVHRSLQQLDGWSCVSSESFRDPIRDVDAFFREQMESSDLFVGLIGHHWGEGHAQQEHTLALQKGVPSLLFLAPDDLPIPANLREPEKQIEAQANWRRSLWESTLVTTFSSPEDLSLRVIHALSDWALESSGEPRKSQPPKLTRYLQSLREETAHIEIRGLRVSGGSVTKFRIDEIYTPLTTVLAPEEPPKNRDQAPAARRSVPLQGALKHPLLVLVGDPGAGKSTFLRRIAFAACETLLGNNPLAADELIPVKPCPLPLLIRAASLAAHIQSGTKLADAVSPDWLPAHLHQSNPLLDASFFRDQLETGSLLLVDGLDEAPDPALRKALAALLRNTAAAYPRARIVATSRPLAYGGETVIPGFATVQIAPLQDAAVETFAANWCRALYPAQEAATRHQAELLAEINSSPEIRNMAVNPVMLTALASLHWNQRRLPAQRSELYASVLNWLAESRESARGRPAVQCLALMEYLAYVMHTGPRKEVEISRTAAAQALASRFRELPEEQRVAAAEGFLENEETDSGILVSRGDTLRFWHLTFQEYLTARALAVRDADRTRLLFEEGRVYQPVWRETVLLLAGVLCGQDTERVDAFLSEMLDQLTPESSLADRARSVGLMGRILRDLKAWNYTIADPRYHQSLERCLAIFKKKAAREIDFAIRLEAAEALGQAGDPRFDPENTDAYWVRVEGGAFQMGESKQTVTVSSFLMAPYPVTVAEYTRFVEAGGYKLKRFWSAGGYEQFDEPRDWQDQLRHPNRPVTSVSWFEASAYCAWAGGRLPSESEWEYAARSGGKHVRYPWGDPEPDRSRANFSGGPGHPTPVGLYPAGATPAGIHDLAGNLWEWVRDHVESESGLRGGSWFSKADALRASSRYSLKSEYQDDDLGFRCVRDLVSRNATIPS